MAMTDPVATEDLIFAVVNNNLADARQALENGADANAVFYIDDEPDDRHTPLMIAIYKENIDVVQLLLKHGANPRKRGYGDGNGAPSNIALCIAAERGRVDIASLLLRAGALVDEVDDTRFYTPIMHAITGRYPEMVTFLTKKGCNVRETPEVYMAAGYPTRRPNYERSILYFAVMKLYQFGYNAKDMKIIRALIAAGAGTEDSFIYDVFYKVIRNTQACFVRYFLKTFDIPQAVKNQGLFQATSYESGQLHLRGQDHQNVVQTLLNNGASVYAKNAQGRTALQNAQFQLGNAPYITNLRKKVFSDAAKDAARIAVVRTVLPSDISHRIATLLPCH